MCATETCRHGRARRQRGLSIIELMVGIVISLLVGLAASISAVSFTASQRQGIATGSGGANASLAMAVLKNDIAAAGLGFFGDSRFLCNRLNLSIGNSTVLDGAVFSPVQVTAGAAADQIDAIYASEIASGTNVRLGAASGGADAELRSLLPALPNQEVLIAPEEPSAVNPCVVRTVTAVQAADPDNPQRLSFGPAGRYNKAAFTTPGNYADRSRVTLLGGLHWSRYRLQGTDLLIEQPLNVVGNAMVSEVLMRNVIGFRAQYGIAAAAPGSRSLESWQDPAGAFAAISAANIGRVRALRVGIVTRSVQREKVNANGLCEASTAKPSLYGVEVQPDVPDWQCFRYRSAEVVIPLRNFAMGLTPTNPPAPLP